MSFLMRDHFESIWAAKENIPNIIGPRVEDAAHLIRPCHRLLDLGSGSGNIVLAARGKVESVIAVDLAFRPLPVALSVGALSVQADFSASALPFKSETFDSIACLSVLQYSDDPRAVLKECYRVLSPSGQLIIVLPNMRTLIRIFKLAILGRFPIVSRDLGYDGGTRHYFCQADVIELLVHAKFCIVRISGRVPRPSLAALIPEWPLLRQIKTEFFCAEMILEAKKIVPT